MAREFDRRKPRRSLCIWADTRGGGAPLDRQRCLVEIEIQIEIYRELGLTLCFRVQGAASLNAQLELVLQRQISCDKGSGEAAPEISGYMLTPGGPSCGLILRLNSDPGLKVRHLRNSGQN